MSRALNLKHHQRLLHLLNICSGTPSLPRNISLHALIITLGPHPTHPLLLHNNLISLYASQGRLSAARRVFDTMPNRNVVSYSSIICAYSRFGHVHQAWGLFSMMRDFGFSPKQSTVAGLLSCLHLSLCGGSQLHAFASKTGLVHAEAFVGTALLGFYGRHGCILEAVRAFEDVPAKNLVTWNSIISLHGHWGSVKDCVRLFLELVRSQMSPSGSSFVGVLSGCKTEQDLEIGLQLHGSVIKTGLDSQLPVHNSLVNMYVKCGNIWLAEKCFQQTQVRDNVSWNTIIGALAHSEDPLKALQRFVEMSMTGCAPNRATYVNILASCISLQILVLGQLIHAKAVKSAFESDVFVGSSLVDFYSKCGRMDDANRCFSGISNKSIVSWNALIMGYVNKCSATSISLLQEMLRLDYQPNEFTFSCILKAPLATDARQLHCLVIKMGYEHNEYVMGSLMSSYARKGNIPDALAFVAACEKPLPVVPSNVIAGIYNRCGRYNEALELLSLVQEPDGVSWNIAIAACARAGHHKEAFELFRHMRIARVCADKYTFVSLLSISSKLSNLALGRCVHGLVTKMTDSWPCDTLVFNILIDMYGKCGSIEGSLKVFEKMTDRNLITWTALISALGINGHTREALERFKQMECEGLKPDSVAFLAALSVCGHGGMAKEGMELFWRMKEYGVEAEMEHYRCVVDLLARYGFIKEAEHVIGSVPFQSDALLVLWRTFVQGWKKYTATATATALPPPLSWESVGLFSSLGTLTNIALDY